MASMLTERLGVQPGLAVIAQDGKTLGTIKDVSGSYFKVDAPMHRDYWLSAELVVQRDQGAVFLSLPKPDAIRRRLPEPGLEPDEDPFRKIATAPVIGDHELLEQRAHMERELAEQSRHLPAHEPSITEARGPRAWERIPADHAGFREHAGTYVPNAPIHDEIEEILSRPARRRRMMRWGLAVAGVTGVAAASAFFALRYRRRHASSRLERVRDEAMSAKERILSRTRAALHRV